MPRMCFSNKCMHANQYLLMIFFISGCGYSRLALYILTVMKTNGNNKRGEADEALRRQGVRAFKSGDSGG